MSGGINCVVISGNLCDDGEIRVLPGGETILKLRIAVNDSWQKDGGERQERTDFFSAQVFGKRAEALAKYMTKGKGVVIQGKLRTNKVGEGNATRWFTDIRVSELSFTGNAGESRQRSMVPADDGPKKPAEPPTIRGGDDDFPF